MRSARLTRRRMLSLTLGGAAAILAACTDALDRVTASPAATPGPTEPPATSSPAAPATAEPQPQPALAEKVAGMLLVGFRGTRIDPASSVANDLGQRRLSGVLLFDRDQPTGSPVRNVESPAQLAELTAELQAIGGSAEAPLIVAIDQEGGRVARLGPGHGFPDTPSAADLGAVDDPAVTEQRARDMAETLAAAGINLNLAPVLDLDINPSNPIIGALDRSFSADPAVVTAQATAFVRGHRATGVATALKHFPGHGSSLGDTHLGVVDVTRTWSETELEPFRALIDAGMADAILTAHVFNAGIDPDHPATLSRATIGDLLRGQLGYDGVVISDDLQMGAIRDAYGFADAVRLAIEAGVDLLTFANQQVYEEDVVERVVTVVVGLVEDGELAEARIDESWRRIGALRARLAHR